MKKVLRSVPVWLINLSSVGLGFFSFVVAGGILTSLFGARFTGFFPRLLVVLAGFTSAYFSYKHSRGFMLRHMTKSEQQLDGPNKRIARILVLIGAFFFIMFIFALISSIINTYV